MQLISRFMKFTIRNTILIDCYLYPISLYNKLAIYVKIQ